MIYEKENTELRAAMEIINQEGLDGLSLAVEIILNEAMKIECSQHLKAIPYERTEERVGYASGFKPKQIKSRVGQLNVSIPQVRESDFYPLSLEKGMRSERALRTALAEMYVTGVSTRKVEKITQKLVGFQ